MSICSLDSLVSTAFVVVSLVGCLGVPGVRISR